METCKCPSEHLALASAVCVSLDAWDGPKLAYCCTSHITYEDGPMLDKVPCKLVIIAGDASGYHYFYGDVLAHDVTACTV